MDGPVLTAAGWGLLAACALPIGALAARLRMFSKRTLGAVLAFGAGTLISAVTFELVEQAFLRADLWPVVAGLGLGAVTFTAGDAAIARRGGRRHRGMGMADRETTAEPPPGDDDGAAIALGAVLDGIPESLVLGIGVATGDAVSITFVAAVFISNLPESLASTRGMLIMGHRFRPVLGLWMAVAVVSAVVAAAGAMLDGRQPNGDRARAVVRRRGAARAHLGLTASRCLPRLGRARRPVRGARIRARVRAHVAGLTLEHDPREAGSPAVPWRPWRPRRPHVGAR